jgi:hypothetical protein
MIPLSGRIFTYYLPNHFKHDQRAQVAHRVAAAVGFRVSIIVVAIGGQVGVVVAQSAPRQCIGQPVEVPQRHAHLGRHAAHGLVVAVVGSLEAIGLGADDRDDAVFKRICDDIAQVLLEAGAVAVVGAQPDEQHARVMEANLASQQRLAGVADLGIGPHGVEDADGRQGDARPGPITLERPGVVVDGRLEHGIRPQIVDAPVKTGEIRLDEHAAVAHLGEGARIAAESQAAGVDFADMIGHIRRHRRDVFEGYAVDGSGPDRAWASVPG